MKKIMAIGEALIDFIPSQDGSYMPHLGGAPCNVAGAYVKLSGQATLLTQLGDDLFGQRIRKELIETGIDVSALPMTKEAKTSSHAPKSSIVLHSITSSFGTIFSNFFK